MAIKVMSSTDHATCAANEDSAFVQMHTESIHLSAAIARLGDACSDDRMFALMAGFSVPSDE